MATDPASENEELDDELDDDELLELDDEELSLDAEPPPLDAELQAASSTAQPADAITTGKARMSFS